MEQLLCAEYYSRHVDMEARRQSPVPHGDKLYVEIFKRGREKEEGRKGGRKGEREKETEKKRSDIKKIKQGKRIE